jgi:hypothetical protein
MLMAAVRRLVLLFVGLVALGVPAGALAAEGGCPNEALRQELGSGFLPDCRAYEMVTPAYKEGYAFHLTQGLSSDGDRAFAYSFGAVAGIEGEGGELFLPGVYMDTRTASGWQLAPVTVPLSEFVGQTPVAFEADSGMSLWEQHTPAQSAQTQDLYVRSASGMYSLVGPLTTPENSAGPPSDVMEEQENNAHPVASTSDYSHVVIRAPAAVPSSRWPFDHTAVGLEASSLYEYSGTGNQTPLLVGVTGGRESHQLVGECGTRLGSGERGSAYNALSSDGETILFTPNAEGYNGCGAPAPATYEVWARRHGSLQSAESVDISARAPEPACTGGCRSSVESGKAFEGASENGEKVFFTSTQRLLNGASQDPEASDTAMNNEIILGRAEGCAVTTGAGGCNLYEYDFNAITGDNLRLVAGGAEVLGVARIAENGSRVYFVARGVLTGSGNEFGAMPVAGQPNLYVYDSEEAERDPGYKPVFIATLSSADSTDWRMLDRRPVQATPDGRFLVFASSQPGLTPGDTATADQLFEYDAQTGELVRVSQGEDGNDDNGNDASISVNPERIVELEYYFYENPSPQAEAFRSSINRSVVADDGMSVVFESAGRLSRLATAAEQGCTSVYEYRSSGSIADGGVHLISDGVDVQPSRGGQCGSTFLDMDTDGENILFETDDSLLPSDTDGAQPDVYDARVDGGFALPPLSADCRGEGCLGAPGVSPTLAGAGSGAVSGGGNLPSVVSPVVVKPRVKSLTRAQKLAKALKECRRGPRRRRAVCEARARKRYAVTSGASKANGRGKR